MRILKPLPGVLPVPAHNIVIDWPISSLGNRIFDLSHNGNTATLFGGTSWARGRVGRALYFNGLNSYTKVTTNRLKNQRWSVALWVWTGDQASTLIDYENGSAYFGWSIRIILGGFVYVKITSAVGGTLASLTSNGSVTDALWHLIIITDDGSNLSVYIDGVFDNSAATAVKVWAATMHCYMGCLRPEHVSPANWFTGRIDNVMVFDRALYGNECALIYRETFYRYPESRVFAVA